MLATLLVNCVKIYVCVHPNSIRLLGLWNCKVHSIPRPSTPKAVVSTSGTQMVPGQNSWPSMAQSQQIGPLDAFGLVVSPRDTDPTEASTEVGLAFWDGIFGSSEVL